MADSIRPRGIQKVSYSFGVVGELLLASIFECKLYLLTGGVLGLMFWVLSRNHGFGATVTVCLILLFISTIRLSIAFFVNDEEMQSALSSTARNNAIVIGLWACYGLMHLIS